MGISFAFRDNVQVIELEGTLSAVEEAAIRMKLDQKINQGRTNFLVNIANFLILDPHSVTNLQGIIRFCVARDSNICVVGLKKANWKFILIPNGPDFAKFETESESKPWFEALAKKTSAAAVPAAPKEEKDLVDELKAKAIAKLLEKYEVYFSERDYDPHMIEKIWKDYSQLPSKELMHALHKAQLDIKKNSDDVLMLDQMCNVLASKLGTSMLFRKAPISALEITNKKKSIEDSKVAIQKEIAEVKSSIQVNLDGAQTWKTKSQDLQKKWTDEIQLLEKIIVQQKEKQEKLLRDAEIREKDDMAKIRDLQAAVKK